MQSYSKSIKRLLLHWKREAHERELHRELLRLDEHFASWRRGEMSSGELAIRVHEFDAGAAREVSTRYDDGDAAMNVAYALVTGILGEGEVPPELVEVLARPPAFYRNLKERGELRYPGEL